MNRSEKTTSRREALIQLPLTAICMATSSAAIAATTERPRQAADTTDAGYRETDHVRTAYARMRF